MNKHLSNLRWTTAILAIVPGWEIGKTTMAHIEPATHELELLAQAAGTLALGYAAAYFVIGIIAAQFLKRKQ
jgi:hypothetical protein